jgi:uridine monophosphate synthetase
MVHLRYQNKKEGGQQMIEKLEKRITQANSILCVGLDPRVEAGEGIRERIFAENKRIIDAVLPYTACFKPNSAFYECWGEEGIAALKDTLAYIPDEVPILLDAKRGDIGATAEAYAQAAFDDLQVDMITLSPYMGKTSAEPFTKRSDKGFFFLCRTSNPGAERLQSLELKNGKLFYQQLAEEVQSWSDAAGLVVAANDPATLTDIRERNPTVWILAPGIGVQGGNAFEAVLAGKNEQGTGILPVVVRGISQAEDPAEAARLVTEQINNARKTERRNQNPNPLAKRIFQGLLDTESFRTGSFTLKSGKVSPFYIDLRRAAGQPEVLTDIAHAFAGLLKGLSFDRIAGIPTAGLPFSTAVSLVTGIPMVYPRMNSKGYGTGAQVEGSYKKGEKVLLLDDLITTGKSKLEAVDILKAAGLEVSDLLVLLERGEQGRRDMNDAGIELHAFAPVEELFAHARDQQMIDETQFKDFCQFVKST